MLRLLLHLEAGQVHATPWGRHVNEGEIEWPPSPWRLCRALVAVGFGRLGWKEVPEVARRLLGRLSACLPVYFLPRATTGHTRHYMPQFRAVTARVLDAFAYVGRGACLGVEWDIELGEEELALFDALVGALGYLGRAESWVRGERVTDFPEGLLRCAASDAAPGPGFERVGLLSPLGAEAYARWREEALEREAEVQLERERQRAAARGKGLAKSVEKRVRERVLGMFPRDGLEVLLADTGALQAMGWSQPPGTQWVSYWREEGALMAVPEAAPRAERGKVERADTALLALASDTSRGEVLPRLSDALPRAELLHASLVKLSDEGGEEGPSPVLTGRDDFGQPLRGHRHAMVLPMSLLGGGRVDHVVVVAEMGLDEGARRAISRIRRTYATDLPDLFVTLVGLGEREDFEGRVPALGQSEVWVSATPFVAPRFLKAKGKDSLFGQVQAELASRGLPEAVKVEVELANGDYAGAEQVSTLGREALSARWRHFKRERRDAGKGPPMGWGFGLRLSFAEAVRGPVALGYASHFGLGMMVPDW